jgi:hypothetical protein
LLPLLSGYTLVSALAGSGFTAVCLCDDGVCVVSSHGTPRDRCCPSADGYCHPLLGLFCDATESEGTPCGHCTSLHLIRDADRGAGLVKIAVPASVRPPLAGHHADQFRRRFLTSSNEVSVDGSAPGPLCGTVVLRC